MTMPTKNLRLNIVLEPHLYKALEKLTKRDGTSLSLKARDLIQESLEYDEDSHWAKETRQREKTFNKKKTLTHKEVWS